MQCYVGMLGSVENEALENEDRSTKHPKTRKRITLNLRNKNRVIKTGCGNDLEVVLQFIGKNNSAHLQGGM